MNYRITRRDNLMLESLAAARWLTTTQLHLLCFSDVTVEMVRRRIRVLRQAGYVFTTQTNRMAEALHSLGPQGKRLLFKHGWSEPLRLERRPPKNLEHFRGINDIRVATEWSVRAGNLKLGFFFACWELQQQSWDAALIPDAVCQVEGAGRVATLAFEYDRGEESPEIIKSKYRRYEVGVPGFPIDWVVMVADTPARAIQLASYATKAVRDVEPFLFFTLEEFCQSFQFSELW